MNHSNWKKLVRIGEHSSICSVYDPDVGMAVSSLLKRWKHLDAGMEASSEAYKALTKHFKHKIGEWLEEDKQAQEDRQSTPSSMDIYDTVKQKGMCILLQRYLITWPKDQAPSRADVQWQLIKEERNEHSIRGQTSWILCGIKIQEMQYVHIQYIWSSH